MTHKSADSYIAVFNYIEKFFELKPARFMADFEGGIRKSIRKRYPKADLHGCWFHYCSSIRRKFRSYGMAKLISDNRNVFIIYRMLLHLPLLPAKDIYRGFVVVKNEAKARKVSTHFKKAFEYFENYWIELVCFFPYQYGYSIHSIHWMQLIL